MSGPQIIAKGDPGTPGAPGNPGAPGTPGAPGAPGAIAPITANTTAGATVDNLALAATVMSAAQLARQVVGNALPATILENNANLGTQGVFWTAQDAAAAGGTVNHVTLMNAAMTWSANNGRAVIFGPWLISINVPLTNTMPGVHLIFHPDTRVIPVGFTSSSQPVISNSGNNLRIDNGVLGPTDANAIWTHWHTGLPLNVPSSSDTWSYNAGVAPAGAGVRPDFNDFFTVYSGALPAGAIVFGTWQTSATQFHQINTNTLFFDGLPVGMTIAQLNAQLALAAIPLQNNQYLNVGSVIPQGTVIALSTIGNWTGYAVTVQPSAKFAFAVSKTSYGPIPALPVTPETPSAAACAGRPALPPASILLLSAAPYFQAASMIRNTGNGVILKDVEFRNISGGFGILSSGDRLTCVTCKGWATDGHGGSAPIRVNGGSESLVIGMVNYSGDQAGQWVTGGIWANGAFVSGNKSIVGSKYIGCRLASLSAQTVSFGLTIQNSYQNTQWALPNGCVQGNTLTIPGPIPNGLTLAALQASGPNVAIPIYMTINKGGTVSGAVVSGAVQNGNGSYTINLTPPAGVTNCIKITSTASLIARFTTGVPLGALTCSIIGSGFHECEIINLTGIAINGQNGDSQGTMEVIATDNVIDSTWCLNPNPVSAVSLTFGTYGGGRCYIRGNRFIQSLSSHMSTTGVCMDAVIDGNIWGSVQNPSGTAFSLLGIQGGRMSGGVTWCVPGADTITLGGADYADNLGETASGQTNNFDVDSVVFRGAQDGQFCVRLGAGTTRRIRNAQVFQASPLGSGAAGFAHQNNATGVCGPDYVGQNNLSMIDGFDYGETVTPQTYIYGGDDDINNIAPAVAGAVRTPRLSPKRIAAIQAASGSNELFIRYNGLYASGSPAGTNCTYTLAPFTAMDLQLLLAQGQTCASATITIPPPALAGQRLRISTQGAITALSLLCTDPTVTVQQTAGSTLPANTSLNFVGDIVSKRWDAD